MRKKRIELVDGKGNVLEKEVERGERGGDTSNNTTRERRKVKHQQPGVKFSVLRMRGEENTKGPVEIWPN